MAVFNVTTGTFTHGAVDQALHVQRVNFAGNYADTYPRGDFWGTYFQWGLAAVGGGGPINSGSGAYGYYEYTGAAAFNYWLGDSAPYYPAQAKLECDRTYVWRARVNAYDGGTFPPVVMATAWGTTKSQKTNAVTAVAGAPSSSAVTSVTASVACSYYPNTYESSASAQLQYKRNVDPGWTNAGSADVGTGYSLRNVAANLTGLLPATLYDVRLVVTRTTNNDTSLTSATAQFTTLGAEPTITTNAASVVTGTTATLNGTVNPNSIATTYFFDYGTTVAYELGSTAAQGPNAGAVPVAYNQAIGPLTAGQLYHFRAHAVQGGVDYYGADLTLFTDAQGHIMPTVYQHFAKYGVATDFYFCVETPASTGADRFLSAAVPWVAGDVKVDKDGAGLNNVSALPTRIGSTALYKWAATAGELAANKVNCLLIDADGPAWRDCHIAIETRLLLGQVDVDASAMAAGTHAMSLVGVGTGYGLFAKGSSGIRGEAQGTSGHGIVGQGIGAGYGLAGGGASGAFKNNVFEVLEGAEPVPGDLANAMTMMKLMQTLKRRFTNKVTQDSSNQVWYKDNSATVLATRTVSDDLTTQVQNKLF